MAVSFGVVALGEAKPASAYVGGPWFEPGKPYTQNFPDPTVVWDGTKYWAYGTSTGGSLMPAMSSTDLKTWMPRPAYSPNPYNGDPFFNDSFPVPPGVEPRRNLPSGQGPVGPGCRQPRRRMDRLHLLGGRVRPPLHLGRPVVVAGRPVHRQLLAARSSATPTPVDRSTPQPFIDSDGTPYLVWKASGVPGSAPTKTASPRASPATDCRSPPARARWR